MIEKREKRKRIFYVPGMISLVFIPLFCFYHFYKTDAFKDERCIDIFFPNDSVIKENFLTLKRKYHIFSFNNLERDNNVNLNKLQLSLRKLKREHDTINGVQIHLGKEMNYEVYIKILDLFSIEKIPVYVQYKNDFFVLMLSRPKKTRHIKIVPIECGNWEANKEYFIEQEKERQFNYVLNLYKKYWVLFLGYLGILSLNILVLVKFNKNQNYNQK